MRARLFFAVLFLLAAPLFALDVPPTPTHWFTDTAGVVDSASAAALDQKLSSFEQQSGTQFIIYIFPTVGGEAIEDFTVRCAEKWKVGNKKYDNGLILFIFLKERKARIEVGYGLEPTITDAVSARVIRNDLAPHLRQNDWVGGLNAAADSLMSQITKKEQPVAPVQPRGTSSAPEPGKVDIFALVILFLVFVFVVLPLLRRGGCGGCGGCGLPFLFWPGGGGGGFTMGGGGWGGGGGGGFSSGGGSFGGGGATGGW